MGGDEVTLGEVHRVLLDVREKVEAQNGRVNQHATEIAVLRVEQQTLKAEAAKGGRNWGAGAGTLGGLLGGFLASFLKSGQ